MQRYKNLFLIGTSHISVESIEDVKSAINSNKPDIIALELDRPRFNALVYEKKHKPSLQDIKQIGFKGFLFNLIGAYIEKKLGKLVGTSPGDEMKAAVKLAFEKKLEIALIDQDIRITLRNISKRMTLKEKLRFVLEILTSSLFGSKLKIDLRKVPSQEVIDKMTKQLKEKYPSLYISLITDRNKIMAKRLYTLMASKKKILAVVGAGHEGEIIALIKREKGEPKYKLDLLKPKQST